MGQWTSGMYPSSNTYISQRVCYSSDEKWVMIFLYLFLMSFIMALCSLRPWPYLHLKWGHRTSRQPLEGVSWVVSPTHSCALLLLPLHRWLHSWERHSQERHSHWFHWKLTQPNKKSSPLSGQFPYQTKAWRHEHFCHITVAARALHCLPSAELYSLLAPKELVRHFHTFSSLKLEILENL